MIVPPISVFFIDTVEEMLGMNKQEKKDKKWTIKEGVEYYKKMHEEKGFNGLILFEKEDDLFFTIEIVDNSLVIIDGISREKAEQIIKKEKEKKANKASKKRSTTENTNEKHNYKRNILKKRSNITDLKKMASSRLNSENRHMCEICYNKVEKDNIFSLKLVDGAHLNVCSECYDKHFGILKPIVQRKMQELSNNKLKTPDHYNNLIQPTDIIEHWGLDNSMANVVKYAARAGKKKGASYEQDVKKIIHYAQIGLMYWENRKG